MVFVFRELKNLSIGKLSTYLLYSYQLYLLHLMDPWGDKRPEEVAGTKFEDNFEPNSIEQGCSKLADSEEYLAVLERKLRAVRSKCKVLENLSAYRADCIERLMRDGCDLDPVIGDTDQEKLLQDQE